MLIVKNQTVIDCLQLVDCKARDGEKKSRHFRKTGTLHFRLLGEYSKLDRVKTMVLVEKLTQFDEILR